MAIGLRLCSRSLEVGASLPPLKPPRWPDTKKDQNGGEKNVQICTLFFGVFGASGMIAYARHHGP